MKKINFLIAFAISNIGFSQTILNQQEITSRIVQDPQTVIMLPGFHATSTTVNPFIAKIGNGGESGGPIDSGAGVNNPSGTVGTNYFHDTQGNIEVNGGGQLQYTLPIVLPPGIKSVAPQINLVYTCRAALHGVDFFHHRQRAGAHPPRHRPGIGPRRD